MEEARKQLAEVLLITFLLMGSIAASGYVTLEVLGWDRGLASVVVLTGNLLLAWFLIARYDTRRVAAANPDEVARRREEKLHRRIEELSRDPRRAKYVADLKLGIFLTDPQIDYLEDPTARVGCPHLRAVEGLMRDHGIRLTPLSAQALTADTRVDEAGLCKVVAISPTVKYYEYFDDREADPQAGLRCGDCPYTIYVRHPMLGGGMFPVSEN